MFVTRLTGPPRDDDGGWLVGPGEVDAIDFTSSRNILIKGISMFGSVNGPDSHHGLIEIKETSSHMVVASESFQFDASGGPEYYDKMFSSPQTIRSGIKYSITIEYHTSRQFIYYAEGGVSIASVDCDGANAVNFAFSDSSYDTSGSETYWGQIPKILFSC